jgi:hypothetical protein
MHWYPFVLLKARIEFQVFLRQHNIKALAQGSDVSDIVLIEDVAGMEFHQPLRGDAPYRMT